MPNTPINASLVLPYRRQYYCESGMSNQTTSGGPAGLVGREVANAQWLSAMLRYGTDRSLGFLLHEASDQPSLTETLQTHCPKQKHVRMGPIANAKNWLGGGGAKVVWEPQPPSSRWAWLRNELQCDSFALCGITHALCSANAIRSLRDFIASPIMPYDRLVCTSTAVAVTANSILEHAAQTMRGLVESRADQASTPTQTETLRLHTIPLGVDTDHHRPASDQERTEVRRRLGITADANVVLFVGRLSHHAKSNPLPLFAACREAANQTDQPVVLIMSGWFAGVGIRDAFVRESRRVAGNVKVIFVDGTKPELRDAIWDSADVFVSLADSIQETFGLTVVEAMSRGIPVVASDFDGYRESVIDGETGFLIPTSMMRGIGDEPLDAMMRGDLSYDHFLAQVGQGIRVDMHATAKRLVELFSNAERRVKMGTAGRRHAEQNFAWPHIISRFENLWQEQRMQLSRWKTTTDVNRENQFVPDPSSDPSTKQRRMGTLARPLPLGQECPSYDDDSRLGQEYPSYGLSPNASFEDTFSAYPSQWIDDGSLVQSGSSSLGTLSQLCDSPLANHSGFGVKEMERIQKVIDVEGATPATDRPIAAVIAQADAIGIGAVEAKKFLAWAMKFDLLQPARSTLESQTDDASLRDDAISKVDAIAKADVISKAGPSNQETITFSVTCMGRLDHLKQTLPLMVAQPNSHVVVVDYACPDRCGDWIEQNYSVDEVTVVRVADRERFDRSEAKNIGIAAATTRWVCVVDADVKLKDAFADHLRGRFKPGYYLRSSSILEGTGGTFVAEKAAFLKVGMHDPVYQGWGEEDDDLLDALQFYGVQGDVYDESFVDHLDHGDELRTRFHDYDDRRISHMINRIYRSAKWDMARMSGSVASEANRQQLYENVSQQIRRLVDAKEPVHVVLDTGAMNWVPLSARCSRELVYRIKPDESAKPGQYAIKAEPGSTS